jgi:nitrogen fixation/metabolism regulation signal transduction histidine kinase
VKQPPRLAPPGFETRLFLLALGAGLPAAAAALALAGAHHSAKVAWTLASVVMTAWLGLSFALRDQIRRALQTLSALLGALREGDFSIRSRHAGDGDALSEVGREINILGEVLREQRLGALEAAALARTVMEGIDVAVLAFDGDGRVRLANRAAERLLGRPAEHLMARGAAELDLGDCLEGEAIQTLEVRLPGGSGRWGMRRSALREKGQPLQLVVLSDLSRALREEERQAWQRLIRVLGHELNNSLTPIRSMAGSLASLLDRRPRPADWEEDARRGLQVMEARAESLNRFMIAYARLAGLPPPRLRTLEVGALVRRVAGLETRLAVEVIPGRDLNVRADPDQIEQLLINLIRNAADAALETGGGVRVGWEPERGWLEVRIEDDGPGLSDTGNLFVPFFTTKPSGSGIGLVLSRQIAEAHGGSLALDNRSGRCGCRARLRLPL